MVDFSQLFDDAKKMRRIAMLALCRLLRGKRHFELGGKKYEYFLHEYNVTFLSERIVEMPIAFEIMDRHAPEDTLEVGNVTSHYRHARHTIVDKYEKGEGIVNQDIVDFSPGRKFGLIVSISTIEHVGVDEKEKDPLKAKRAILHLKSLLAPGGEMLVTIPVGYHRELEKMVKNKEMPISRVLALKRISADNMWVEVGLEQALECEFEKPFRHANALLVLEIKQG